MKASSSGLALAHELIALTVVPFALLTTLPVLCQAPPKINVPYHCPNGLTYTVLACKPYRADQWCQWKEEQNGNVVTTANSAWTSMTGRLQGCTIGASNSPGRARGSAATDPSYLADMPSVDRVKAEIKGKDPTDTLERQVAVFTYLGEYIKRIKYNRSMRSPFTPDESRVMGEYSTAAYQIQQDYKKSHSADEANQFDRAQFNYMLNNGDEWARKLIGTQSAAAYNSTLVELNTRQRAHVDEINRQNEEAKQRADAAAVSAGDPSGDNPNDPTVFASRRCAELGGSGLNCAGKGLMSGILGLAGVDSDVAFASGVSGVVINGVYHSRTEVPGLTFTTNSVSVNDCGKLVSDARNYKIRKSGPAVQVVVSAEPEPVVLAYRPDGSLAGPGSINLKGRIITGYTTTTSQLYINGSPAVCNGIQTCTTSSVVPTYGTAMARCTIGNLAPPPTQPAKATAPKQTGGPLGLLASAVDNGELPSQGGLRMSGMYASSTGLVLNFENSDVILDCGRAHARQPYTVENGSSAFIVHVESPGAPFALTVASDGSLRGSGHTTVNGRLFAGMNNGELTFRPTSASCDVGTFSPKSGQEYKALISNMPSAGHSGAASTTQASYIPRTVGAGTGAVPAPGSVVMPPAASGARAAMHVIINSGFPAGHNPLANQVVSIRREPMPAVLRKLGVSIPSNATSGQATQTLFSSCRSIDCRTIVTNLKSYDVGNIRLDGNGAYTVNVNETTGPYFFFSMVRLPNGSFSVWDVPADLHPGENIVTFQPDKAETFKIDVNAAH